LLLSPCQAPQQNTSLLSKNLLKNLIIWKFHNLHIFQKLFYWFYPSMPLKRVTTGTTPSWRVNRLHTYVHVSTRYQIWGKKILFAENNLHLHFTHSQFCKRGVKC
jgi:hypothetical protein